MSLVSGKQYSTEITSRKNFIINGNFDVWQRGTSFVAIAGGDYAADRFQYGQTGAMVHTITQDTTPPTYAESGIKSNYAIKVDCTTVDTSLAAGDFTVMRYKVEGHDYTRLAGNNATLSFWVKATKTGTYCVAFINDGNDRSYVKEYTIDVADTWEKKTIIVPLDETGGTWDYTNGAGLKITFTLATGTTYHTTADTWQTGLFYATSNQVNSCDSTANNFHLSQMQFEVGTVATDMENRFYSEEFALCQRYFERFDATSGEISLLAGYANTTSNFRGVLLYGVQKRSTPTASISSTDGLLFYYRAAIITSTTVSFTPNKYATYISAAGTPLDIGDGGHINLRGGRTLDIDAEL